MVEDSSGKGERKRGHCYSSPSQSFVEKKFGSMGEGRSIEYD